MIDIAWASAARAGLSGASAAESAPVAPAANALALDASNRSMVDRFGEGALAAADTLRASAVAEGPRNRQPTRIVTSRIAAAGPIRHSQAGGHALRREDSCDA
jgi:hypothetical protein